MKWINIWNKLLDATIYYSFDKRGYERHKKNYFLEENYSFEVGQKALVTGGTSGIGKEVAFSLEANGVRTFITGRDERKGREVAKLRPNLVFLKSDLAQWDNFLVDYRDLDPLDYVVLNAGGMPSQFTSNIAGIETQAASQLFGHYYLLKMLERNKKLKPGARVVWVTSGGMYLKSFKVEQFFSENKYDKVECYANVKRAQVEMLDYWSKEFPDLTITGMHPGWVKTPGLDEALSSFTEFVGENLRNVEEGADTILWLLGTSLPLESGSLYFDRRKVDKNLLLFSKSKKSDVDRIKASLVEFMPSFLKPY